MTVIDPLWPLRRALSLMLDAAFGRPDPPYETIPNPPCPYCGRDLA